ncbi:Hypothetical protein NocV09_00402420 [Nannochloropsis oceanica]
MSDNAPVPEQKEDEMQEEEDIDDEALEEEGSAGEDSSANGEEEEDEEEEREEKEEEEEKEGDEASEELRAAMIGDMPEEEKLRLKEVVWAKSAGFAHWPGFIYHPADVKEDLRKSCYSTAKAKHGPKTHHICFYFGYGANSFAAVPFKNIELFTKANEAVMIKALKRDKAKIADAIKEALEEADKPKEERSPGPPDTKSIKKQEQEEKKKAKMLERQRKNEEKKTKRMEDQGATGKKKRKKYEEDGDAGEEKKKKKKRPNTSLERVGGSGAWATKGPKKMKKDFEKESEEERFNRLSRNLQILLDDQNLNVPKICSTLEKVSSMAVTIEQLTESGVGQVVKGLRKHAEAEIQTKAKAAFTRWKESFKQDIQPAALEQVAATDSKMEKKEKESKTDAKDEGPATSSIPQPAVPPSPQEKEAAFCGEEGQRDRNGAK